MVILGWRDILWQFIHFRLKSLVSNFHPCTKLTFYNSEQKHGNIYQRAGETTPLWKHWKGCRDSKYGNGGRSKKLNWSPWGKIEGRSLHVPKMVIWAFCLLESIRKHASTDTGQVKCWSQIEAHKSKVSADADTCQKSTPPPRCQTITFGARQ